MEDFNSFAGNPDNFGEKGGKTSQNIFDLVNELSAKFDGKNTNELLSAIYKEAKKGKQNGTLKNSDIDNFAAAIAPFLDDKKAKLLQKVVADLKKI